MFRAILQSAIRALLRRPFYRGQDRIFHYCFRKKLLDKGTVIAQPLAGNFNVACDTSTWIGARIYYLGDYETQLKAAFKAYINKSDVILDVGANIGFHSLYFAWLTGESGKVISFEPVPMNYVSLTGNIALNGFRNIQPVNLALSDTKETINIHVDEQHENPGSFSLLGHGGSTTINCITGDEFVNTAGLDRIDLIKIDVEGYEPFVMAGLSKAITRFKPKVIFEYSKGIQLRAGQDEGTIFQVLKALNYTFSLVTLSGLSPYDADQDLRTGNIVALPPADDQRN